MIHGYAKLGSIDVARSLFDGMPKRVVVVCNTMMVGLRSKICLIFLIMRGMIDFCFKYFYIVCEL